ncbi:MAG: class I SAM-dependent methyltransferase [bacterium]
MNHPRAIYWPKPIKASLVGFWRLQRLHGKLLTPDSDRIKTVILSATQRASKFNYESIIRNIRPGMHIVDIGAGTGAFTFMVADALKGTGMVYATEIDPQMLEYLREKAEAGQYKNVSIVKVEPEGIDPFYKSHSFDVIFMANVFGLLKDSKAYFEELRGVPKKNTGRLYLIDKANSIKFTKIEFGDFSNMFKILISEGEDFPVFVKLRKEAKDFIRKWQGEKVPPHMQRALMADLNIMLSDRWFWPDLSDYYSSTGLMRKAILKKLLNPRISRRVAMFIDAFDKAGVFNRQNRHPLDDEGIEHELHKFNGILLRAILCKRDTPSAEKSRLYRKDAIVTVLKSAGYEVVQEHDSRPNFFSLEFRQGRISDDAEHRP